MKKKGQVFIVLRLLDWCVEELEYNESATNGQYVYSDTSLHRSVIVIL